MAFPQIVDADTKNGTVTGNSTSWTLTYPTNLQSGDLIIALIAADGTGNGASGFPAGWQAGMFGASSGDTTAVRGTIAKKVSDGTETGDFTVTISASEQGGWRVFRITGWGGTLGNFGSIVPHSYNDAAAGDVVAGWASASTGANPDPPSLDPNNWATEDTLWIAACMVDTSRTISVYPLADRNTADVSGGSNGATLGVCTTTSAVSSLDPSTFTTSASDDWIAATIAVRPAAVAGNVTVTPGAASLTTSGSAPAISLPKLVTPTAASLATAASVPTVGLAKIAAPTAASLTTSGTAPTVAVTNNVTVTPTAASLATSASAPTVATTDYKTVLPSAASLATSASAPTVTATDNQTVAPSAAAISTSASAPTVTVANNVTVTPSAASLTTSASAPDVVTPVSVQPDAGSLATTGSAPVLATGVTPSQAALSTTASTPVVAVSDNQVALPSAASLVTEGSAPAIVTPVAVAPEAAALVTTGSAPTVVNPISAEPTAAALTITASAPPLTLPGSVEPAAAALTLTTETPAVLIPTVILPAAASLSLTAEAPDVAAPALSEPSAAELTITASAPDIALPVQVAPDAVDLTLTSATPAIAAGGDVHVVPGPLGLTLVGKRPSVKAIHARPRVRAIGSIAGLKRVPHAPQAVKPEPAHLYLLPEPPLVTMIDDGDIMDILALIA